MNGTVAEWDLPWTFTVTWDVDAGALPAPILRLFRFSSEITPGTAVYVTDRGHSRFYVRAVEGYLAKYHPDRSDIKAVAQLVEEA